jgi:hypothetical protein
MADKKPGSKKPATKKSDQTNNKMKTPKTGKSKKSGRK